MVVKLMVKNRRHDRDVTNNRFTLARARGGQAIDVDPLNLLHDHDMQRQPPTGDRRVDLAPRRRARRRAS